LRPLRYSLIVAGLFVGWLSAGVAAANADPPSARDVVDSQIKNALAILRDAKLTQAQKREKIGEIADQHTDFETLSRLTLGRYWRDLSADQRAAFVEEFKKHLSNTYGNLLDGYTGEDVKVTGDRREPNGDWTVQTRIIGTINGTRQELAKVDCRLRRNAEWKVIDVIVEGVSLVAIFRAQFQEIMANGGFDRLLRLLREKVGEKGGNGSETNQKESRQSWGGDPVQAKTDNQRSMNLGPRMGIVWRIAVLCAGWALIMLSGCAGGRGNIDPWEKTNRFFYNFDDGLDRVLLKPVSDFYVKVVPEPVRTGLGNGFNNLGYGNVILNDLLQAKWKQGLSDTGRMAVNSTIGIAGIFDVASRRGLLSHQNDFGITLGKWGAKPGPYLVLPLLGPSTVRDAPGLLVASATNPVTWVNPPLYVTAPLGTVQAIDGRSRVEAALRFRNAAAIDPYVFTRNAYLQYRDNLIHEGKKAVDQSLYEEEPESARSSAPAATRAECRRGP